MELSEDESVKQLVQVLKVCNKISMVYKYGGATYFFKRAHLESNQFPYQQEELSQSHSLLAVLKVP